MNGLIRRVWYTQQPLKGFYGTNKDWNQGILTIINNYVYESRERKLYAIILKEYLKLDIPFYEERVIICNKDHKEFFSQLDFYNDLLDVIFSRFGEIRVKYVKGVENNVLKYRDGIYENEIILINDHYGK